MTASGSNGPGAPLVGSAPAISPTPTPVMGNPPTLATSAAVRQTIEPLERIHSLPLQRVDLLTLVFKLVRDLKLSLVVGRGVQGPVDIAEVLGVTVRRPQDREQMVAVSLRQILENVGRDRNLGWHFSDGLLVLGARDDLRRYLAKRDRPIVSRARFGATLSGEFRSVELPLLLAMMSEYAAIGISGGEELDVVLNLHCVAVPWEQLLKAIVYLHRLDLQFTEFGIRVIPGAS